MNPKTTKQIVPFRGTEIITFEKDGEHFIAIKPICDSMGIEWSPQLRKLKRDEYFNSTMTVTVTVGADGKVTNSHRY